MRILYYSDTLYPEINGVTNTLARLGDYLTQNSIEHIFFSPEYPQTNDEFVMKSPVKRFKSIALPLYRESRLAFPSLKNLSRASDEFKPDIVHVVVPAGIAIQGIRYAVKRKIPIVASFHTNFDMYLDYYKVGFLRRPGWAFLRWFHGFSLANFAPSYETIGKLNEYGLKNLRLWSRGIDHKNYNPGFRDEALRKRMGLDGKITFLYVGRLAKEKNLELLNDAIGIINRDYADSVKFVITGEGPYSENIRKRSYNNVVFTGYLANRELSQMYSSADVFVFPSGTETLGNVILEAMASGLPVIGVNSGGVRDHIKNGFNGFLTAPDSPDEFASSIKKFIENSGLVQEMSVNALGYMSERTWEGIFKKLVADYSDVLSRLQVAEKNGFSEDGSGFIIPDYLRKKI